MKKVISFILALLISGVTLPLAFVILLWAVAHGQAQVMLEVLTPKTPKQ